MFGRLHIFQMHIFFFIFVEAYLIFLDLCAAFFPLNDFGRGFYCLSIRVSHSFAEKTILLGCAGPG